MVEKPVDSCLWITDAYFGVLDIMINSFSFVVERTKDEPEHDKYANICSELISHKLQLQQILKN
jgi:hypothetical protein